MSLTWWVSGNGLWMSPQGPNTNYVCLYVEHSNSVEHLVIEAILRGQGQVQDY